MKGMQEQMGRGRGSRGRGRGRVERPKGQFFVKDGKNYSYKVSGSVAVANAAEAEAVVRAAAEEALGGGGRNAPIVDANPTHDGGTNNLSHGRGRGGPRKAYDPHHRKDRAMKKHFSSISGL
jgi:activating signal cointegrator complex subunit 2